MPRTITTVKCLIATALVLAAAALAGTAAAGTSDIAPGGSGIPPISDLSGGSGCSISCIVSAIVTPTASSASVKITTSVQASVIAKIKPVDQQLGLTTSNPQPKHVLLPTFQKVRTVLFPGLTPKTTYRITVSARDKSGHTQTRSGTFKTRAVKVAVGLPDVGLSATTG